MVSFHHKGNHFFFKRTDIISSVAQYFPTDTFFLFAAEVLWRCFTWGLFPGGLDNSLPAMQETWVQSLGWEDPLEEGMATHSSILAWGIPTNRVAWRAIVHGVTNKPDTTEQPITAHLSAWYCILVYLQHTHIYIQTKTHLPIHTMWVLNSIK